MTQWLRELLFLPERASTFADRVDALHYQVFLTTMGVWAVITLVMGYFFVRFRRKRVEQSTEPFHPPLSMEVFFVAVPLVVFLGWFTIGFRDFTWYRNPPPDAIDVYATGKKWMWKFTYPEGPNAIDTLHVPVGRPVRVLITSRDVIHSFFVPAFRVKQDAIPGRYTETWFIATRTGVFDVFCAEYCGLSHSRMLGKVVVMPVEEFEDWRAAEREQSFAARLDADPTRDEARATLVTQGERLALEKGCGRCHTVDGTPHLGPTWRGLYRSMQTLTTGENVVADEAYLTRSMMNPGAQKVAGYFTDMPSYFGLLTNAEAAALVEYIKSLKGEEPAPGAMR
ncbi:MAG: cytochrome c oxidase subunit II [Myxococcaceae bacterium]|nr:cytochrome c oxidase subunit II [Myxococcaceae bacterium]